MTQREENSAPKASRERKIRSPSSSLSFFYQSYSKALPLIHVTLNLLFYSYSTIAQSNHTVSSSYIRWPPKPPQNLLFTTQARLWASTWLQKTARQPARSPEPWWTHPCPKHDPYQRRRSESPVRSRPSYRRRHSSSDAPRANKGRLIDRWNSFRSAGPGHPIWRTPRGESAPWILYQKYSPARPNPSSQPAHHHNRPTTRDVGSARSGRKTTRGGRAGRCPRTAVRGGDWNRVDDVQ